MLLHRGELGFEVGESLRTPRASPRPAGGEAVGLGIDGEQLVAGFDSWPSATAMRTTLPDTSGVISTFCAPT